MSQQKTLILIAGPTAVGKTKLSIELALKYNCPVISCDSRQFYKKMDIGTAKPTSEEMKGVQHYFLDFLDLETNYTAGIFEREALSKMDELFVDNNVLIMVGGSTLYIDAITKGFDDLPKDPLIRKELIKLTEEKGIEVLLKELEERDPEYFEFVDKSNEVRIQRALEVVRASGQKFSELRKGQTKKRNFNILKIALDDDRDVLYDRINKRVDVMLENGLEEEARGLIPQQDLLSLKTVGYQEFFQFFKGEISKDKAIELIKRNSRRYAKRQLTWFRRDEDYAWFGPDDLMKIKDYIETKI
jgi:tRNA dimethylallyltransferase